MATSRFDKPARAKRPRQFVSQSIDIPFGQIQQAIAKKQADEDRAFGTAQALLDVAIDARSFIPEGGISDAQRRDEILSGVETEINEIVDEGIKSGDFLGATRKLQREIAPRLNRNITRGELSAIGGRKAQQDALQKKLEENESLTVQDRRNALQISNLETRGISERTDEGGFFGFSGFNLDPVIANVPEKISELTKDVAASGNFLGARVSELANGKFIEVDSGEGITQDKVYSVAIAQATPDREIRTALRQPLDIIGRLDPEAIEEQAGKILDRLRFSILQENAIDGASRDRQQLIDDFEALDDPTQGDFQSLIANAQLINAAESVAVERGFFKGEKKFQAVPQRQGKGNPLDLSGNAYTSPAVTIDFPNPILDGIGTLSALDGGILSKEQEVDKEKTRLNAATDAGEDPDILQESQDYINELEKDAGVLRQIKREIEEEFEPTDREKELFDKFGEFNPTDFARIPESILEKARANGFGLQQGDPEDVVSLLRALSNDPSVGTKEARELVAAFNRKQKVVDKNIAERQFTAVDTSFRRDTDVKTQEVRQDYIVSFLKANTYYDTDGNRIDGESDDMADAGITEETVEYMGFSDLPIPGTQRYAWGVRVHELRTVGNKTIKTGNSKLYYIQAPAEFTVEKAVMDGNLKSFKTYITQAARVQGTRDVDLGKNNGKLRFKFPTQAVNAGRNEFVWIDPFGEIHEIDSDPSALYDILQAIRRDPDVLKEIDELVGN